MTTAPESRRVANNQPVQPGSGEPGAIARAIVARAQWVQRALSPWVGRWLRASAGTETGRETSLSRHAQTALTGTHTNRLLDRVQRVVDRATVWRADVGSVEPAMVDRFTSAIADRFSATGARYEPQPLAVSPAETTDLVLAGTPVQPGLGDDASLEFEAGGGEPAPKPTVAQLREMLATRSSSRTSPPVPGQPSPPRVQRAAEPPGPRPPARTLPAQARLFSRVEELPPRGELSPEGQRPEVRLAQAEPAPAEQAPPSERTRISRINGSEVQRLPEEEMPSQVPTPTEPPPSERARMSRISGSEVQRLHEEEMPSQVPAPTEAPPSEGTRIGRISGSEVQRLPEEEMSSQVPLPAEAPPSEGTRIGRISGSEVQRLSEEKPPPSGPEMPAPPQTEPEPPRSRTRMSRVSGSEVRRPSEEEPPPSGPEMPAVPLAEPGPPRPRTRISRISGSEVQQQLEERSPPSGPEMPAPPLAEPEPPRPRTRISRISGSEVQRQFEEKPPPSGPEMPAPPLAKPEPPRPPAVSREVTPGRPEAPPLARVEPPMEPGQPAGQPQPALSADAPSVAEGPALSAVEGVQRKVEPEKRAAGLGEEVLARAASSARLPLTEPLSPASGLGRTRSPARTATLPQAQVQARFADERVQARFADEGVVMPVSKLVPARVEPARAGPARSPAWGGEFPLPPVSRPAPAALIQRQPVAPSVDLTVAAQGADVVQRAVETPSETGLATEEEGSELDLDHLARQVYPLIKRMLAVERERRSAR